MVINRTQLVRAHADALTHLPRIHMNADKFSNLASASQFPQGLCKPLHDTCPVEIACWKLYGNRRYFLEN
jgi:hypothetical protein